MSRLLLISAGVVLGLTFGWLAWGRAPSPATVQAAIDRAERAEELADSLVRIAVDWADSSRRSDLRADSLAKLAQIPRQIVRVRLDTVRVALAEGDTAKAVAGLLEAVQACQSVMELDSLALSSCRASAAAKDSAISVLGVTVDSLRAAGRQSVGVLKRTKSKPWNAGVLLERGGPVGGYLSRDVWMLRLGVEATDGKDEPATIRASIGVRF